MEASIQPEAPVVDEPPDKVKGLGCKCESKRNLCLDESKQCLEHKPPHLLLIKPTPPISPPSILQLSPRQSRIGSGNSLLGILGNLISCFYCKSTPSAALPASASSSSSSLLSSKKAVIKTIATTTVMSPPPTPTPTPSLFTLLSSCSCNCISSCSCPSLETTSHSGRMRRYRAMQIDDAAGVLLIFRNLKRDIDSLTFHDGTLSSIFSSILNLQNGNKYFNEKLGQLGVCELVISLIQSMNNSICKTKIASTHLFTNNFSQNQQREYEALIKLIEIMRFLCVPGLSREALIKENIKKIGNCGGMELLILVMNVHKASAKIIEAASWVIIHLATNDDNRIVLGRIGACEAVLLGLLDHKESAACAEAACWAIKNMSFQNDYNKTKFGAIGTCEVVAAILSRHGEIKVSKAVWGAIINLSCEHTDNKARFDCCGDALGLGFMKY